MSTFQPVTLSDGVSVPGVGYGLGTANFNNDTAELVELVKTAVKVGYRHLDGAEAYNRDEMEELVEAAKPEPQRAFMKHMDDDKTEY